MTNQEAELYDGLPMPRRFFSVIAVTMGVMLAVLNGTLMNVALPSMAQILHLSNADSIWIVNGFQLAIIMSLLMMSAIGEIYSYRKTYLVGMSIFTLSSVCCGLSNSFTMLLTSRILQGIGAAAMMAINMTLLRLSYPKHLLGKGIGLNATIVAIASVAGPSIAAFLLAFCSWRWLFYVNIPLGIIGLIIGFKALPENIVKLSNRKFPTTDIIMNAMFFGSFILAFEGFSHGFDFKYVMILIMAFVVFGFFYIRRELHEEYPLLPLDLLRIPIFNLSVLTSIASFTTQMLAMVALPFYFQHTLHMSASQMGLLFTAWPAAIIVAAPLAGSLIGKVHGGILGGIGLGALALGLSTIAILHEDASNIDIIWRMLLCGFGFGLFQSPNNNILMTTAPANRSGSASGMLAMARLLGQTSGATLVALMFIINNNSAPRMSLWVAALVSALACIISFSRLSIKKANA